MEGVKPLVDPSTDEIVNRLSKDSFNPSIQERTEYANALLAWAEQQGPEELDRYRNLVFTMECAKRIGNIDVCKVAELLCKLLIVLPLSRKEA